MTPKNNIRQINCLFKIKNKQLIRRITLARSVCNPQLTLFNTYRPTTRIVGLQHIPLSTSYSKVTVAVLRLVGSWVYIGVSEEMWLRCLINDGACRSLSDIWTHEKTANHANLSDSFGNVRLNTYSNICDILHSDKDCVGCGVHRGHRKQWFYQ